MRYFITFVGYGTCLHGDGPGAVDRDHNLQGSPGLPDDPERAEAEARLMDQSPYIMDQRDQSIVLEAICEVCSYRGWLLLAAHVRTNHVHVVVEAEAAPEKVMGDFKRYASRSLGRSGRGGPGRKRWARHGSTLWLWKDEEVRNAVKYVVEEQGAPMAVFCAEGI
jgi:REP element-mobilizing transposase RayT